jgi:hypothetical protein
VVSAVINGIKRPPIRPVPGAARVVEPNAQEAASDGLVAVDTRD